MKVWLRAAMAVACLAAAAPLRAETYPARPITIVVPAPAGGVADMFGRVLAQHFNADWGQKIIVENRPGANNQVGADYVAHQPGDGYTLLISPEATFVVNPMLFPHLGYDVSRDFTPIAGLVALNHALVVNPSIPVGTVKGLIALGKQRPGQLNYGTFGVGSSNHLAMELFKTMAGVNFVAVHYKGASPAMQDVIANHIQMMFLSTRSAVPQWRAGAVKLIAIGAAERLPELPEIPTVAEGGLPGYVADSWFGLFGPGQMPPDVVAKINAEVRKIFADPQFAENLRKDQYFTTIAGTPEELAKRIRNETPKWRKLIEEAHIKAE